MYTILIVLNSILASAKSQQVVAIRGAFPSLLKIKLKIASAHHTAWQERLLRAENATAAVRAYTIKIACSADEIYNRKLQILRGQA